MIEVADRPSELHSQSNAQKKARQTETIRPSEKVVTPETHRAFIQLRETLSAPDFNYVSDEELCRH